MKLNSQARSLFLPAIAAVALAACSDSAAPTDKFTGPSGFTLLNVSNPIDITTDGKTAVFQNVGSLNPDVYSYDIASGALSVTTQVAEPYWNFATGVSDNGRISALYGSESDQSAIWTAGSGWHVNTNGFEGCDRNQGGAWDVSADGQVAVGNLWENCSSQVGLRWTATGGVWTADTLERLGAATNRASVVSANGLVAAGFAQTDFADRRPAVWQADGSGSFLASGLTDDAPGEVQAINSDGSMMAGVWNLEAFYWTAATGTVFIGKLGDSFDESSDANAIAAGGQLIFGGSGSFGAKTAFVWTAAAGMRSLQDIAKAAGIEIPQGVVLNVVKAASADGTIVIGQATDHQYKSYSFVLKLPVSAYGL